jgi:hypothetical protein
MHNYSLYTCDSLMLNTEVRRLWRVAIPEEALKHPFLMQGLLAMSALHLTSQRPNERSLWTPLALKHQNTALAIFRSTLPALNAENCHALFCLSILISVTSMAFLSYGTLPPPGRTLPVSDIIEPFTLIRGCGEIVGVAAAWLCVGPIGSILTGHVFDYSRGPETAAAIPVTEHFRNLHAKMEKACPNKADFQILSETLLSLQSVFTEVVCSQGDELSEDPGVGWKWPNMVSKEYIALLRESHGGALVLYAHFAIISEVWKDKWYLKGWPARVVQSISSNIDLSWKECMKWPEKQIREGFPIFNNDQESGESSREMTYQG